MIIFQKQEDGLEVYYSNIENKYVVFYSCISSHAFETSFPKSLVTEKPPSYDPRISEDIKTKKENQIDLETLY